MSKNSTVVTEFILLGLTDRAELQPVLFVVFLAIYLTTVVGNVSMILLIRSDSRLHTPMYFFLSHLSFLDLCYATNVTPQMLVSFLSKRKTISVIGCFIQFHFFIALVITDYYMLTVMAYDRYMAICKPLLYGSKMSRRVCISLVVISYTYGFANGLVQTILMLRLSFCGPNEIEHFFCDFTPLVHLSCTDTSLTETIAYATSSAVTLVPFLLITASYSCILTAVLRIPPGTGRQKAFSTCSSHLASVAVFYGTLIATYLVPAANSSQLLRKGSSLLYTVLTPMFNPIIYSLRNRDIHEALKNCLRKRPGFLR